jgi:hypothetical protein
VADRAGDVSSSAEVAEKKPPSVIVKFGKQDGTYYSKKQELFPPSTTTRKDKDRRCTDSAPTKDQGSNGRSRSSSSSGSLEPLGEKSAEVLTTTRENSRGYASGATMSSAVLNSSGDSIALTVVADKKANVKPEPVEFDEDMALSTLKVPTGLSCGDFLFFNSILHFHLVHLRVIDHGS